MLRINKDVDLKELEKVINKHKFSKWFYYDSDNGKLITTYIGRKWGNGHSARIKFDEDDRIIYSLATETDLDFLFDLIKSNLLEKVSEGDNE